MWQRRTQGLRIRGRSTADYADIPIKKARAAADRTWVPLLLTRGGRALAAKRE